MTVPALMTACESCRFLMPTEPLMVTFFQSAHHLRWSKHRSPPARHPGGKALVQVVNFAVITRIQFYFGCLRFIVFDSNRVYSQTFIFSIYKTIGANDQKITAGFNGIKSGSGNVNRRRPVKKRYGRPHGGFYLVNRRTVFIPRIQGFGVEN